LYQPSAAEREGKYDVTPFMDAEEKERIHTTLVQSGKCRGGGLYGGKIRKNFWGYRTTPTGNAKLIEPRTLGILRPNYLERNPAGDRIVLFVGKVDSEETGNMTCAGCRRQLATII